MNVLTGLPRCEALTISPTAAQLASWTQIYVPEFDVFYLKDRFDFENMSEVVLYSAAEFFGDPKYQDIELNNAFEYWKRSKDVQYVMIAPPHWFGRLPETQKRMLNQQQVELNRGLVFPLPLGELTFGEEYVASGHVVLCNELWAAIDRDQFLLAVAKEWDDGICLEMPADTPEHLRDFADSYPDKSGGNCLGAAIFALCGDAEIANVWLHQEPFLAALRDNNYHEIPDDSHSGGDVVVGYDKNRKIQHAAYCVTTDCYFNKDGQSFFNPWKLVSRETLETEWPSLTWKTWRCH